MFGWFGSGSDKVDVENALRSSAESAMEELEKAELTKFTNSIVACAKSCHEGQPKGERFSLYRSCVQDCQQPYQPSPFLTQAEVEPLQRKLDRSWQNCHERGWDAWMETHRQMGATVADRMVTVEQTLRECMGQAMDDKTITEPLERLKPRVSTAYLKARRESRRGPLS